MNLRRITSRAAVAGISTALAAGALVGAATTSATAASAGSDYTCAVPLMGDKTFPLTIDVPWLLPSAAAGLPIPSLGVGSTLTAPADVAAMLGGFNVDGAASDDFAMGLGSTSIGVPLTFDESTTNDDGTVTFSGGGANEPFTTPAPGTYDAMLPTTFTLTPTVQGAPLMVGENAVTLSCSTASPASLGQVQLVKQTSEIKPAVAKAGTKGYKVTATVTDQTGAAAGKVVAKIGSKTVGTKSLDKKGKAVFSLPKSAKGKKVTLSYKGDKYTAAAKSVKVTVK